MRNSFLGSIGVKIGAILFLMATLTVAAIYFARTVYADFELGLSEFQTEQLPELELGASMIEMAGDLGESLSGVLVAGDGVEMSQNAANAKVAIDHLRLAVSDLDEEERPVFAEAIVSAETNIARLVDVKTTEINQDVATLDGSDQMTAAVSTAHGLLSAIASDTLSKAQGAPAGTTAAQVAPRIQLARDATEIDGLLGELSAIVMTGASADDLDGVVSARDASAALAAEIRPLVSAIDPEPALLSAVDTVLRLVEPDTGILAARHRVIEARGASGASSRAAADAVAAITAGARALGAVSINGIRDASTSLTAKAQHGSFELNVIAAASFILVIFASIGTFVLVVRPLSRVAGVTERLAQGDMSPVELSQRSGGEIGRMARALQVFRDGMIEQDRLKEEERKRDEADRERARRDEETARARETAERERQRAQEEADRAREAKAQEEREAVRAAADAERLAATKAQQAVVDALAAALHRLSEGDLTVQIDTEFPPAYEEIRQNFNSASASLRDALRAVFDNTASIRDETGELASAAEELSIRTERQAATLEETASAMDSLTSSVRDTADGAGDAFSVSDTARKGAEDGVQIAQDAMSAMAEITASSNEISKITSVIEEISFQTNLLALNAGVEAARAGESGKGFAVVASEVRALAQRSAEAAAEINGLISTSGAHVLKGSQLVERTGGALGDIVEQVDGISGRLKHISAAAAEQSGGISEINTAIGQLDQVTQQNAAMFEETSAASLSLRSGVDNLVAAVSRFNVGTVGHAPAPVDFASRAQRQGEAAATEAIAVGASGPGPDRASVADDNGWDEF